MKATFIVLFLLTFSTASFATEWVKVAAGYNSDGEKKYLKWERKDLINLAIYGLDKKEIGRNFTEHCMENNNKFYDAYVIGFKEDDGDVILTIKAKWYLMSKKVKVVINKQGMRCFEG